METPEIHKELEALINLIDEPDETIFRQICDRILTYKKTAIPYLEKAWKNNLQPMAQHRIEVLLHKLQFENLYDELTNWYSLGGTNLLMGYILASKYQYPNLDEQKVKKEFERLKQDIWLELNPHLTAFEKVGVINKILYTEKKFEADRPDFNTPSSYFINNIIDTHTGNHLSLALVQLILSGLAELPVYGVNLPGNFILAYMDEHSHVPGLPLSEAEVLFYINPASKGAFFTRHEIDLFLKQRKIEQQYSFYRPCSNIIIIKRMLQELYDAYKSSGNEIRSGEIEMLLRIFS